MFDTRHEPDISSEISILYWSFSFMFIQGRPSAQRGEAQALGPQIFLDPHLKFFLLYIFLSFMVQKKIANE